MLNIKILNVYSSKFLMSFFIFFLMLLINCAPIPNLDRPEIFKEYWKITDSLSLVPQNALAKALFYYDNSISLSRKDSKIYIAFPWAGRSGDTWIAFHQIVGDTIKLYNKTISSGLNDMLSDGCTIDSFEIPNLHRMCFLTNSIVSKSIEIDDIPQIPRTIGFNEIGIRKVRK